MQIQQMVLTVSPMSSSHFSLKNRCVKWANFRRFMYNVCMWTLEWPSVSNFVSYFKIDWFASINLVMWVERFITKSFTTGQCCPMQYTLRWRVHAFQIHLTVLLFCCSAVLEFAFGELVFRLGMTRHLSRIGRRLCRSNNAFVFSLFVY